MSSVSGSIYAPLPLAVANYNFEQGGAAPGTGWQNGGPGLTPSPGVLYDTSSPYEGLNSLEVTADSLAVEGVSSVATYKVAPGEIYRISATLNVLSGAVYARAAFTFLNASGNVLGEALALSNSGNTWIVVSAQATAPVGSVTGVIRLYINELSGGVAAFDVIKVTKVSTAIPYYLSLFTSQYQNSAKLKALATALMQPFVDTAICSSNLSSAFALASAVGEQLDVLGEILGVSRTLPFNPVGVNLATTAAIVAPGTQSVAVTNTTYVVVGQTYSITGSDAHTENITILSVVPGTSINAHFAQTHVSGSTVTGTAPSALLGDADYLTLIQAKVLQNQWNGQVGSLWAPWQTMFPGGHIYITDNQNMTATIFLLGSFTPVQQQMITNGLIVPRPQAVQYTYTFPVLPLFGFDNLNPAFVAGFDTGRWD